METRTELQHFIATSVSKMLCSSKNQHIVFLTHTGFVYTRGANHFGQLGLGDTTNRFRTDDNPMPTQILELENIIDIFTGQDFTFCLNNQFQVYAFGNNNLFQLGLDEQGIITTPQLVTRLENRRIIQIETNATCSYFLDVQGYVHITGFDPTKKSYALPTVIADLPPIKNIFICLNNTFFLTHQGEVYAYGLNNHSELGLNCDGLVSVVRKLELSGIKDIGMSRNATFFLDEKGQVFACGKNTNRQITLCLKEKSLKSPFGMPAFCYPNVRLNIFDGDPIQHMVIGKQCNIFFADTKVYIHFRMTPPPVFLLNDESVDMPATVAIPLPLALGIQDNHIFYINTPSLFDFDQSTTEYQLCQQLLQQRNQSWLDRNRLLVLNARDLELCDYLKAKFAMKHLSQPAPKVYSLRILSALVVFKSGVAELSEDVNVFMNCL